MVRQKRKIGNKSNNISVHCKHIEIYNDKYDDNDDKIRKKMIVIVKMITVTIVIIMMTIQIEIVISKV